MNSNELCHYGILGMKWGVRRTPAQLARARGKTSFSSSNNDTDNTKAKTSSNTSTKKKLSEMSDDELSKAVRRLQMEQQYRNLNPEKVSTGKKFVDTLTKQVIVPSAVEASKNVLRPLIESGMNSLVKKATKKK